MNTINPKAFVTAVPIASRLRHIIYRALVKRGIVTVTDLCTKSEDDIGRLPGFKSGNTEVIKAGLAQVGLHLGMSETELSEYRRRFLREYWREAKRKQKRNMI